MILYHGSNIEIDTIDLSKSKPYKDFGKGFYLSDTELQAVEMAKFKVSLFNGTPTITKFEFEFEQIKQSDLNILIFEGYSLEWVDFIISNRTGIAVESFDFVYGPIADDKVGLQLQKYKDGNIDKEELIHRLKFNKGITFQYYFGSEESIKFLRRI